MKEKHVKMKKSYNDKIFDIINVMTICSIRVIRDIFMAVAFP